MYIPNLEGFFGGEQKRSVQELLEAAVPMQERLLLEKDDLRSRAAQPLGNDAPGESPETSETPEMPEPWRAARHLEEKGSEKEPWPEDVSRGGETCPEPGDGAVLSSPKPGRSVKFSPGMEPGRGVTFSPKSKPKPEPEYENAASGRPDFPASLPAATTLAMPAATTLSMRLSGNVLFLFAGKKRVGTVRVSAPRHVRNAAVRPIGPPLRYRIEGAGELIKEYSLAGNGFRIAGAVYREWWLPQDGEKPPVMRRYEIAVAPLQSRAVKGSP